MNIEAKIHLNKFQPREYQKPFFDAMENKGYKRALLVWNRRAGKDVACFNFMIRQAVTRIGSYYYVLPTFKQARLTVFEGMTNDGKRFLDFVPTQLIAQINKQELKVSLINGSTIYFVGSNDYDALRGTNPLGVIFSEYAYQHPNVYATLRPILVANDGWSVFVSTPFGNNHFYSLYEVARNSPKEWFVDLLTVDDTGVITRHEIEREVHEGIMSPDMVEQEYFCSFSIGAVGAYYAKYLNQMEIDGKIDNVPWESGFPVHTAWDLGMRDQTVIIFFQVIGQTIRIIECYENSNVGLEHYINVVLSKNYTYGKHIAPHDIKVRDYTAGGKTRWDKAYDLGVTFIIAPKMSIIDGIEVVRSTLNKIWIDKRNCQKLIKALRDYRKEYDALRKVYKPFPYHDSNSNFADALRYACISLPQVRSDSSAQDLDKRYQEVMHGDRLPRFFQDTPY